MSLHRLLLPCHTAVLAICAWSCTSGPVVSYHVPDADLMGGDASSNGVCVQSANTDCPTACDTTGTRHCVGGTWGECVPPAELCNGADEDCDDNVDEGFECAAAAREGCMTGCGSTGLRICQEGCAWGACTPPEEVCSGADDDCDGLTDEGDELCASNSACVRGACIRTQWFYEAEGPRSEHEVGRLDGDGWYADPRRDAQGFMTLGQDARDIPGGEYTATFRLMLTEAGTHPFGTGVARIEVNDAGRGSTPCRDCILAERALDSFDFEDVGEYQNFRLTFTAPATSSLEFRVFFEDRYGVKHDRVVVQAVLD